MYGANPYLSNKMQIGFKGGFMAEYDGSIRINTHIDTSGIARGMVEIRQTIERGMSGQKPMRNMEQEVKQLGDSFSNTADKVSKAQTVMESQNYTQNMTKEAKEVQKEIDSLQKKLLSIYDSQERFLATGGKEDSSAYKKMVYDAETLESKLQKAEQTMEALVSSGKAFTIGTDSDAEYMRQAEENIDRVIARLEEKNKLEAQTLPEQPRYGTEVESWQRGVSWQEGQREAQALADAVASVGQNAQDSATKSNEAIASMTQELAELKARQKELEKQGMGLGFEEYDANVQRISQINDALGNYRRELTSTQTSYRELGKVATDALKSIGKSIQKYAINPFITLGKIAAKTFLHIGKSSKKSSNILNKGFKAILKYGLGIRSMYILINKLRTAIKEGFSNLYNDKNIAAFKTQVDSLKASLLTLKNSFAAAFRPLVEVAIPYIQMLIDYMIRLLNVVGQFMAAITGQDKYTRAVRQTTAAIEEQNKAQKKQLSNLDSLNNLTSDNGGGGKDTTGMFEEVPVEDKWQDIVDRLKKMWENSDFSDLGKSIGEWLKNALDSIPWNEIKEKARKLGESIATLINGFIEVPGMGYSIGKTLAEAFNTAFRYLNGFVRKLKWGKIGKFIAESLNGIFENIEWDVISDTFISGAKGIADLINNFTSWFHWDNISDTISNGINIISETIYTFFTETHFDELGQKLGEQLEKSIEKTDWEMVGRAIGSIIQAALDFVTNFISELNFGEVAQAVVDALKGFFETVDMGELAEVIMAALTIKLALKATASALNVAAGAILSALGNAISTFTSGFFNVASIIVKGIIGALSNLGGLGLSFAGKLLNILKIGLSTTKQAFVHVGSLIINGISSGIAGAGGISGLLTADLGTLIAGGSLATTGVAIGTAIIGGIVAAIAGWNFGQFLYEKITGENIEMSFTEQVKEIFSSFTDGSWVEAFKLWGHDIVEGLKAGIMDAFSAIGGWIDEHIFKPFVNGFKKLFGIHSPSTVMAGMGNNIVEGLLNGLKEKWKSVVNWITEKINWLKDKLSGIAGKVTSAFTGGWNSSAKSRIRSTLFSTPAVSTPYAANPAFSALSAAPIPKLATGAVIPANKEFLTVLGDQKHGTNIEAPIGMIEEAVINAMAKVNANSGSSSGGSITLEIPVVINGIGEIGRAVQQFDREFFKQSGRHAFT